MKRNHLGTILYLLASCLLMYIAIGTVGADDHQIEATTSAEFSRTAMISASSVIAKQSEVSINEVVYKEPEPQYTEVDEIVYTMSDVNLMIEADANSEIYQTVPHSTNLHRVGFGDDWSLVEVDEEVFYVSNDSVDVVTEQRLYDIDLLARTIHAESGNQSEEGQRAVGSVIMNRKDYDGYGGSATIEGVISFPNQFSSYKNSDWYDEYSDLTYRIATEVYDGYTNLPREVRCFKAIYCKVQWDLEFYMQIGDHNFYYLP